MYCAERVSNPLGSTIYGLIDAPYLLFTSNTVQLQSFRQIADRVNLFA